MNFNKLKNIYTDDPEMLDLIEKQEQTALMKEIVKSNLQNSIQSSIDLANKDKVVEINRLVKGDKGDQGDPGDQGEQGEKGDQGEQGLPGNAGTDGVDGTDGKDGKDGSPDSPMEIAVKLNSLEGAVDYKVLANTPDFEKYEKRLGSIEKSSTLNAKGKIDQRWHGGGLSKVSHDATMTGDGTPSNPLIVVGGSPLTTKGDVFGYSTTNTRIPVGTNGQVLTADSTNPLGVKWATGAGGGGITDINADTTPSQTLTVGTTGTDFAIVDNGIGDHKFNLPDAGATVRGVVATGAQTFAGNKTFSGTIAASNLSGTNTGDQTITLTGDVTGTGTGTFAATIANDAVTNAKMANMAQSTIKGRAVSAGTGDPTDLTATQATAILDAMTGDAGSGGLKGLVPAQATGDATKFLRGDATWVSVNASGDVIGPSSATDNAVARFDGTTGKLIQNSAVTIADTSGDVTAGKYNTVAISGSSTPTLAVTGTTTVSGANTGDQTSIVGITGTKAQYNTSVTDGDFLFVGDVTQYTDEMAQDAVGTILTDTATIDLTYTDATPTITADVIDGSITLAKMANLAQDQFIGRTTASTGVPQTTTITAAARTVLDDTTVGAMVDTLGGASSTGTGGLVRTTSPTLVTPILGVAAATSINKVVITSVATGATLTIAEGKTLTASNTITFSGTDSVAMNVTNNKLRTITFVIDGGGSTITTGVKGDLEIPFAGAIAAATLLADQSGSIVVDIWKDTYANYPPTNVDSITASAKPTISTATKSQDATLTGWTTSIAAGDTLRFNVDSITTCQRVTVSLKVIVT